MFHQHQSDNHRSEPSWSKLGLGTGTLASLGRAASLGTVKLLLDAMTDCEANVIDTADSYGSGDCEILLGRSLSGKRDSFILVTKAGYRLSNLGQPLRPLNQFIKKGLHRMGKRQRFDPFYISKCLDNSLLRLRTDRVDAFLLHDAPLAAITDNRVLKACLELKQSGKASLIGISSDSPATVAAALSSDTFDVIQTPANLLVAAEMRSVWDACEERGIKVIGNHVFSPEIMALPGTSRERIMRACAALLPKNATILCGTRNPSHFTETCQWAANPLCAEDAHAYAAECLILSQSLSARQ